MIPAAFRDRIVRPWTLMMEQKEQENRNYECVNMQCGHFIVGDDRWVNTGNTRYEGSCVSQTFELSISGCEPGGTVYEVSLDDQSYFIMAGDPLSYSFYDLVAGQSYSYYMKADDWVIMSGTTGTLTEGSNISSVSYQWPCATGTSPVISVELDTGIKAEVYIWEYISDSSLGDWALDDTGTPVDGTNHTTPAHIRVAQDHCYEVYVMIGGSIFEAKGYPHDWTLIDEGCTATGCVGKKGVYTVHFSTKSTLP